MKAKCDYKCTPKKNGGTKNDGSPAQGSGEKRAGTGSNG